MEPETTSQVTQPEAKSPWNRVTPVSKYLAATLFIVLPFAGFWIGYKYATVTLAPYGNVIEQERVVESAQKSSNTSTPDNPVATSKYSISDQKKLETTADLVASIDSTVIASPNLKFTGTVSGSMSSLLGMNLYRKDPYSRYYSGNVMVSGGRWSAEYESELPAGIYVIDMYVLDGHSDFGNNNVVATAVLTVQ
jgi:hypothetical protein